MYNTHTHTLIYTHTLVYGDYINELEVVNFLEQNSAILTFSPIIHVLVWIPQEADLKMELDMQEIYLGEPHGRKNGVGSRCSFDL